MLTKIAHHVGRQVGTFDVLYPVQDETGSVTDYTVTTHFRSPLFSTITTNKRNHGYIMGLDRALQMPKAIQSSIRCLSGRKIPVRETRERLNDKLIYLKMRPTVSYGENLFLNDKKYHVESKNLLLRR